MNWISRIYQKIDAYLVAIVISVSLNVYLCLAHITNISLIEEIGLNQKQHLNRIESLSSMIQGIFSSSKIPIDFSSEAFDPSWKNKLVLRSFVSQCQACLWSEKKIIESSDCKVMHFTSGKRFGDFGVGEVYTVIPKGEFNKLLDRQGKMYYLYLDSISGYGYYFFPDDNLPKVSNLYLEWFKTYFDQ